MAHGAWEALPAAVDGFPAGAQWRTELESLRPETERHLAVHEGHATTVTDLDRILVDAAGDGIVGLGWVAEADGIRTKLKESEAAGSTEIVFAPSGPDIKRELRVFAEAAGL
jgi:5,10-methylenetetrahydromethanopterin reductase